VADAVHSGAYAWQAAHELGARKYVRSLADPQFHADSPAALVTVRELWWPTRFDAERGVADAPEA